MEFDEILEYEVEFKPKELEIIMAIGKKNFLINFEPDIFGKLNFIEEIRYSQFPEDLHLKIKGSMGIYVDKFGFEEYSLREYLMRELIEFTEYEKGIFFEEILIGYGVMYWPN